MGPAAGSDTVAGMSYALAVLGAGNMAEAIVRGVLRAGAWRPDQIIAADVSAERRQWFGQELGVATAASNAEAVRGVDLILLSVKPQQMATALAGLGELIAPTAVVVSIAAGITTRFLATSLGGNRPARIVRCMPNTPMLVGEGMSALAPGEHATADDVASAKRLFEAGGKVIAVTEDQLDAVTAVSGSGPAYFFYLVEQMIRAGVELGLPPEQAALLAKQTAVGAAKMLTTSSDTPAELRRKVTSPGGTTQAAVEVMQSRGMDQIIVDALHAADQRGKSLGK